MGWSVLIISKIVRLVSSVSMIVAEINGVTVVSVSISIAESARFPMKAAFI